MHPRTIAILVGSILAVALVLRAVILHAGLLPLSEEIVLKKATSLTITYTASVPKSVTISDPGQLADLFSVLELKDVPDETAQEKGMWAGRGTGGPVMFHFPNGLPRTLYFTSPEWLGRSQVNPRFYEKLCAHLSRVEGRRIDLFIDNGPGIPRNPGEK
jgi:hypothetical protein